MFFDRLQKECERRSRRCWPQNSQRLSSIVRKERPYFISTCLSEDIFPSVYGRPNFAMAQLFCLASSRRTDELPLFFFSFVKFVAEEVQIKLVRLPDR